MKTNFISMTTMGLGGIIVSSGKQQSGSSFIWDDDNPKASSFYTSCFGYSGTWVLNSECFG